MVAYFHIPQGEYGHSFAIQGLKGGVAVDVHDPDLDITDRHRTGHGRQEVVAQMAVRARVEGQFGESVAHRINGPV